MEEWQKAYLAGFLEADGFISVDKQKRTNKHHKQSYYYTCRGGIANRNLNILNMIYDWTGSRGSIYGRKLSQKNPKWSDAWVLKWNSNDLYWVIEQIKPYLFMKDKQADLIIEMVKLKRGTLKLRSSKQHQQFKLMSNDYNTKSKRYEEIFTEVRKYNKTGPEYLDNNGVNSGELQNGQS